MIKLADLMKVSNSPITIIDAGDAILTISDLCFDRNLLSEGIKNKEISAVFAEDKYLIVELKDEVEKITGDWL